MSMRLAVGMAFSEERAFSYLGIIKSCHTVVQGGRRKNKRHRCPPETGDSQNTTMATQYTFGIEDLTEDEVVKLLPARGAHVCRAARFTSCA